MPEPYWTEERLWNLRNDVVRFQTQASDSAGREAAFAVTAAIEKQWKETVEKTGITTGGVSSGR